MEQRNACNILPENQNGRDHLADLRTEMHVAERELNASGSGQGPAVGSVTAGNYSTGRQLSLSQGFCSLESDVPKCYSLYNTPNTSVNVNVTRP